MKKVLVAGAALLIAGSMVSAASAEVKLSGDAKVMYIGQSDYQRNLNTATNSTDLNGYSDKFDSRVRLKIDAVAPGGAFAKVRMRFDDFSNWDGQGWGAHTDTRNVWADYAFLGAPIGPVTLSGGRMPANFSKWFSWDGRPTRVKADWKAAGGFRLIALIDVMQENSTSSVDNWNDNDFMGYGLVAVAKINDDWSVKGYARYHDDQRTQDAVTTSYDIDALTEDGVATTYTVDGIPSGTSPHKDRSGYLGAIEATGKIAMVGLAGGIGYKEAAVLGSADDGWGWHIDGTLDLGALQPSLIIGGTYDGYLADDDFGFIMMGAAEDITVISQVGIAGGDSIFAGLVVRYAVSDQFKLVGNLAYIDVDGPQTTGLANALEISGSATYVISESADLTYKLGYLSPEYDGQFETAGLSDDAFFGHYLRMAIKF